MVEIKTNITTIILVVLAIFFIGQASMQSLIGQSNSFVFEQYECLSGQVVCDTYSPQIRVNINPSTFNYALNSASANVYGTVFAESYCERYDLILSNIDAGGSVCSAAEVTVFINNVQIGSWSSVGVSDNTGTKTMDVTNIINGSFGNQTIKIYMNAYNNVDPERSCGVGTGTISLKSYECVGDRIFETICPIYNNATLNSRDYAGGEIANLTDFTNDTYFCKEFPVKLLDNSGVEISVDPILYEDIVYNGFANLSNPAVKTYRFFYMQPPEPIVTNPSADCIAGHTDNVWVNSYQGVDFNDFECVCTTTEAETASTSYCVYIPETTDTSDDTGTGDTGSTIDDTDTTPPDTQGDESKDFTQIGFYVLAAGIIGYIAWSMNNKKGGRKRRR